MSKILPEATKAQITNISNYILSSGKARSFSSSFQKNYQQQQMLWKCTVTWHYLTAC